MYKNWVTIAHTKPNYMVMSCLNDQIVMMIIIPNFSETPNSTMILFAKCTKISQQINKPCNRCLIVCTCLCFCTRKSDLISFHKIHPSTIYTIGRRLPAFEHLQHATYSKLVGGSPLTKLLHPHQQTTRKPSWLIVSTFYWLEELLQPTAACCIFL